VPLLGERVGTHRWTAVLAGFAGVIIMMRPGHAALELGVILALLGALGSAFVNITMRRLGSTETAASTTFMYTGMSTVVFTISLAFSWAMPTLPDFLLMASIGVVGGIAQFCSTTALRHAPSALIAPLGYTSLLWMTAAGIVIWGETPGASTLIGAVIICASGLYILYREARRR
jgi:drug/metabolite transporter (DMT)-like permease